MDNHRKPVASEIDEWLINRMLIYEKFAGYLRKGGIGPWEKKGRNLPLTNVQG